MPVRDFNLAKHTIEAVRARDSGGTMDHSEGLVSQMSTPENGKWKFDGSTPITVYGAESRVTVLPAARASLENTCRQSSSF